MNKKDNQKMFQHWNPSTKLCYKQHEEGLTCETCPNLKFCETKPWNKNPYGMRNIKYAMIQTLKNIGKPE